MTKLAAIEKHVIINAPIENVWNFVSTSEGMEKWFMPNDFKKEIGAEFHIQSPFGPSPCKVLELEEPTKLVFEWDVDGWIVSILLNAINENETEVKVIHDGWKEASALITKANAPSDMIRGRMDEGWTSIVERRLKDVVENG